MSSWTACTRVEVHKLSRMHLLYLKTVNYFTIGQLSFLGEISVLEHFIETSKSTRLWKINITMNARHMIKQIMFKKGDIHDQTGEPKLSERKKKITVHNVNNM